MLPKNKFVRLIGILLIVMLPLSSGVFKNDNVVHAQANVSNPIQVYFNDFDGSPIVMPGVGATLEGITNLESVQGYDAYGFGGDFLRNDTGGYASGGDMGTPGSPTTLTLTGLPQHTSIDINFLLAIIDSWDGGGPEGCCHPDILTVTVDGNTIFSESFGYINPSFVPSSGVLLALDTPLGFNPEFGDSAYDMGLNPAFDGIPHSASTLTIEWFASGDGWQGDYDESWAIDDVEIIIDANIEVDIDIKPDSYPNSINCQNEKEVITVAMLTTEDFDAMSIDHTTVTFEGASEVHVNKKTGEPQRHEEDVDLDGDMDLVFHFRLGDTTLDCGSETGTLIGETYDGIPVEGTDSVRMIWWMKGTEPVTLLLPYDGSISYEDYVAAANLLAEMLSNYSGLIVNVVVPEGDWITGQVAAIEGMQSGEVDLAFMSWAAYYIAYDTAEARPGLNAVRFGQAFYRSQILTYDGSGVIILEDLAGRPLCWADWYSVSGHIVPSWMLEEKGIDPHPGDETYSNHNQVVWNIYDQVCDGGGTYVDARMASGFPSDVMDVVFPIAVSPQIPNDGFAFRNGLPDDVYSGLIDSFLMIADTAEGNDLLTILLGSNYEGLEEHDFSLYQGLYDLIYAAGHTPQEIWNTYFNSEACGSTPDSAGLSCQDIRDRCPGTESGEKWIEPDGTTAILAYCNMDEEGNGWTLIYNRNNAYFSPDQMYNELPAQGPDFSSNSTSWFIPNDATRWRWEVSVDNGASYRMLETSIPPEASATTHATVANVPISTVYENTTGASGPFYFQTITFSDKCLFGCDSGQASWWGIVNVGQGAGDQDNPGFGGHTDSCNMDSMLLPGENYTWGDGDLEYYLSDWKDIGGDGIGGTNCWPWYPTTQYRYRFWAQ